MSCALRATATRVQSCACRRAGTRTTVAKTRDHLSQVKVSRRGSAAHAASANLRNCNVTDPGGDLGLGGRSSPGLGGDHDVVVRPGLLHGWAVDFSSDTVRPGFVTGPGNVPLGEGAFRFDTGSPARRRRVRRWS